MNISKQYIEGNLQVTEYENGYVVKVPVQVVIPPSIDDLKKQKIEELQKSYYGSFKTFQSSALGTTKTYPLDTEAQTNLRDYQDRLIADPNKETFYFKTIEDGTLVLHNRVQFLQLMEDAEMYKVNQTIKVNELINKVNNITTTDEINDIVW